MERKTIIKIAAKPNSAVALQPCPLGHITADKREIKDFPKLPSATSFIRKTLGEIGRWLKKKILKVEEIYIYEYEAKAV